MCEDVHGAEKRRKRKRKRKRERKYRGTACSAEIKSLYGNRVALACIDQ